MSVEVDDRVDALDRTRVRVVEGVLRAQHGHQTSRRPSSSGSTDSPTPHASMVSRLGSSTPRSRSASRNPGWPRSSSWHAEYSPIVTAGFEDVRRSSTSSTRPARQRDDHLACGALARRAQDRGRAPLQRPRIAIARAPPCPGSHSSSTTTRARSEQARAGEDAHCRLDFSAASSGSSGCASPVSSEVAVG